MNIKIKAIAAVVLAAGLISAHAQSADPAPAHKKAAKHVARPKAAPAATAAELDQLKQEMQNQINSLKEQLSDRDSQLKQAQDSASAAQAAASRAEAAASSQQQAVTENASAVSTLQSTVTDLKANQVSVVTSIQDDQEKVKKAIENPDAIRYKGITISPAGSFIEAATVNRTGATGGGINTPFTGIPLDNSDAAQLGEFYGSGRQSRLALKAVGKLDNVTLTGYYEMDWLGTGITSNNNQSNSYVMRQRQLWAQAAFKSGWNITAGQMWTLATETTHGMDNGTEILPGTIDPQYNAGFVWARQYGFRVSKQFGKGFWIGASAENAETLNPSGTIALNAGTTILLGTAGVGGGLYDSAANYSFNKTPDFVVKAVFEPGWGHWEVFGIERNFRDRIYATGVPAFNDSEVGAGIGGGFRAPLANKKLSIGLKGLWGQGVGRYGDTTIGDVTVKPWGGLSPLHGFSALSTVEASPTKRLSIYLNYGGDYIGRDVFSTTANVGYGSTFANMSGCNTEPAAGSGANANGGTGFSPSTPANCGGNNKDVQEGTIGYWYNFYNGPKGRLRQGFQYSYFTRNLWSGNGGATNPGGGAQGTDNVIETSLRYYLP
ncbi:MAG TPA: hypothetical protein VHZ52_18270 [Acidobacteriaceae bacterium]|nr:hypothetical protein [Acidobacteriaceae bacterium]